MDKQLAESRIPLNTLLHYKKSEIGFDAHEPANKSAAPIQVLLIQ